MVATSPIAPTKTSQDVLLQVEGLSISYENKKALSGVNFEVRRNEIFGIIGPANSGKTSFLRALNRMDEFQHKMRVGGKITFAGRDVSTVRNLYALRRMIGVVFPLPVGDSISNLSPFSTAL